MADTIVVEELPSRPGSRVVVAAVGPHPQLLTLFEIRKVGKRYDYYVETEKVTRQVYFDALATASADRFASSPGDEEDSPAQFTDASGGEDDLS